MIDIPANVRIKASIRRGAVYYFADTQLKSTEPHYFVVLNRQPLVADFLLLLVTSSQVKKRQNFARSRDFPSETLVVISPTECSLFNKETVIDCNQVFQKTIESLVEKLKTDKLKVCVDVLAPEIVDKLVTGVLASSQVSQNIQAMLRDDNV